MPACELLYFVLWDYFRGQFFLTLLSFSFLHFLREYIFFCSMQHKRIMMCFIVEKQQGKSGDMNFILEENRKRRKEHGNFGYKYNSGWWSWWWLSSFIVVIVIMSITVGGEQGEKCIAICDVVKNVCTLLSSHHRWSIKYYKRMNLYVTYVKVCNVM